jgi:DNA-binding beta-propeller fold protein YncE
MGFANPVGLAVDPLNNDIVVASENTDAILVFSRTASGLAVAPLRKIQGPATGPFFPTGVTVDTVNNEIAVANFGSNSLTVFPRTATGDVPPSGR